MSHTPGPWTFDYLEDGAFRLRADNGMVICARTVATPDGPEGDSNANLIAAAPDLLVALRRLLVRAESELADPEDVHEVHQAKTAISKAEGREP